MACITSSIRITAPKATLAKARVSAKFGLKASLKGTTVCMAKVTLKTPSGNSVIECADDVYILDAAEVSHHPSIARSLASPPPRAAPQNTWGSIRSVTRVAHRRRGRVPSCGCVEPLRTAPRQPMRTAIDASRCALSGSECLRLFGWYRELYGAQAWARAAASSGHRMGLLAASRRRSCGDGAGRMPRTGALRSPGDVHNPSVINPGLAARGAFAGLLRIAAQTQSLRRYGFTGLLIGYGLRRTGGRCGPAVLVPRGRVLVVRGHGDLG
jgi:hypothetical protein